MRVKEQQVFDYMESRVNGGMTTADAARAALAEYATPERAVSALTDVLGYAAFQYWYLQRHSTERASEVYGDGATEEATSRRRHRSGPIQEPTVPQTSVTRLRIALLNIRMRVPGHGFMALKDFTGEHAKADAAYFATRVQANAARVKFWQNMQRTRGRQTFAAKFRTRAEQRAALKRMRAAGSEEIGNE